MECSGPCQGFEKVQRKSWLVKVLMVGGTFNPKVRDIRSDAPESLLADSLEDLGNEIVRVHHSNIPEADSFDVVHIHHRSRNSIKYMLQHWGKPIVFTGHSWLTWKAKFRRYSSRERLERALLFSHYTACKRILALGPGEEEVLSRYKFANKIDVAGNISKPEFRENCTTSFKRGNQLVFVGQLLAHKGVYELIRAMPSLPEFQLNFVHHRDDEEGELRRLAILLGVENRVEFLGPKKGEELVDIVGRAAALVLPSWGECLPSVITEAKLLGTPVIAAGHGMVPDQLDVWDQLIQPGSSYHIVEAVNGLESLEDIDTGVARRELAKVTSPDYIARRVLETYQAV